MRVLVQSALRTLCDMACCASFPPDELERERAVVRNEITAAADDPESCALDAAALAVWPGQDISRPITGTVQDVSSLVREQIADWYGTYFAGGELTVTAAGGINEAELAAELERLPHRAPPRCYPLECRADSMPQWHAGTTFVSSRFRQMQVFELYPQFHQFLDNHASLLNDKEYKTCILIRAGFKPKSISNMLNVGPSYISNIRTEMLQTLFNIAGTPKDFDSMIKNME